MAFENVRLHHQVGLLYLIQYDMKKPKWADHPPVTLHGFIIWSSTRLLKRSYQAICEKHFVSQG